MGNGTGGAHALATLGQHMDAGKIFQEMAEAIESERFHKAELFHCAGGCLAKAEVAYVKSLHAYWKLNGDDWMVDQIAVSIIEDFVTEYIRWGDSMSDNEEREFPVMTFVVALVCLLTLAGYDTEFSYLADERLPLLQKKFRTKEKALSVLDEAIRYGSVPSFRGTILKCHDPRVADYYTLQKRPKESKSSIEMECIEMRL